MSANIQEIIECDDKRIQEINRIFDMSEKGLDAHTISRRVRGDAVGVAEAYVIDILSSQSRDKAIERLKRQTCSLYDLSKYPISTVSSTGTNGEASEYVSKCGRGFQNKGAMFSHERGNCVICNPNHERSIDSGAQFEALCGRPFKNKGAKSSHEKHCPQCIVELRGQKVKK